MERVLIGVLAVASFANACSLQAASLRIERTDAGASQIYAVFMDGLTEADDVWALSVSLLPGPAQFQNYDEDGLDGTVPRVAGDTASFTNALLTRPEAIGGQAWTTIDGSQAVPPPSGPNGIGYAAAKLGFRLAADDLLLNNLMLPSHAVGSAVVVLVDGDGNVIPGGRLEAILAVPEPRSLLLIGCVCSAGLLGRPQRGRVSH